MLSTHMLSPDTEATLLLCGRLGKARQTKIAPLTPTEYARLSRWLLDAGKRPADLLGIDTRTMLENDEPPVPAARLLTLLDRGGALALALEGWSNRGLWVISRSDEELYPRRLRASRSSPPVLYGAGDVALLARGGLAMVGSRDADAETLDFTQRAATACAEQGVQVVSGGARGVDSEATFACLSAGGSTVAVLADSLARAALSGKYRDALLEENLALVSPYDPASGFDRGSAMGRNKYIYALADHALIISSSTQGGTWSGAVEALRHADTPVFVRNTGDVPEGNRLLREKGAKPFPAEPWADLVSELDCASQAEEVPRSAPESAVQAEQEDVGVEFQQGQLLQLDPSGKGSVEGRDTSHPPNEDRS